MTDNAINRGLPTDPPAEVRRELERCLLAYTRGIDRLDGELVLAAFHPGALLSGYGRPGETTIEAFVERAIPSLRDGYDATQHRVTNVTFDQRDDQVMIESYVLAFHLRVGSAAADAGGVDQLFTFNGRYIDRAEERDGHWRISRRELRMDWSSINDRTQQMPGDYLPGLRDRTDPSYG